MITYIGIDIGKLELQVHMNGQDIIINNTSSNINSFIKKLKTPKDYIFIFEPTGGYETLLKQKLQKLSVNYHMVHANKIRAYAKSIGKLAKTDKIDAKTIMDYAITYELLPQINNTSIECKKIRSLVNRREQLISDKITESVRLDKYLDSMIEKSIKKHINWLEKEIKNIDNHLDSLVANESDANTDFHLISSIPAIGKYTAYTLIGYLPELKTANRKQLAALVGVAPYNRDSGKLKGKRYIFGGRKIVRKALYMAAVASLRHSPEMKAFYQRLKSKGKPSKVALVAIMNKLIGIISSVVKRGSPWVEISHVNA